MATVSSRKGAFMQTRILILAGVLAAWGVPALADSHAPEPTGIVKERRDHMKATGAAIKELAGYVQGRTAFDGAAIAALAQKIAAGGGASTTDLFPEGSVDALTSGARPEIWQRWDKFKHFANEVTAQAETLAMSASGMPMMRPPVPYGAGGTGGSSMLGGQDVMAGGPVQMPAEMAVQMNFMHLSSACKSCHTEFRIKKD